MREEAGAYRVERVERLELSKRRALDVVRRSFGKSSHEVVVVRALGRSPTRERRWSLLLEPWQARELAASLLRMSADAESADAAALTTYRDEP